MGDNFLFCKGYNCCFPQHQKDGFSCLIILTLMDLGKPEAITDWGRWNWSAFNHVITLDHVWRFQSCDSAASIHRVKTFFFYWCSSEIFNSSMWIWFIIMAESTANFFYLSFDEINAMKKKDLVSKIEVKRESYS